ncbi:hypothetical protein CUJ86_00035 [Methanofollis fontis]|uniref:Phosphodiesterase n=2 Tax=Methanofollis fontis TaxID=2052832 RepID=A0A483CUQ4_9EURY|nr:hypothetical protein CUJ86_00035 [Methanofollis fontis]
MSRVVVIGIDGLDSGLIQKYEHILPNFQKIKEGSPDVGMHSVFPPDSPTAWTSIYTGQNPAEHGVISFKDPFSPARLCEYLGTDISGKTFWDRAGNAGKKVCVVFPHLGYPVWEVNGVMVGRTTETDIREFDIQIFPEHLQDRYDLSDLSPMTSYPLRIGDIIQPTQDLIRRETDLGLKLFQENDWDLFFIYYSSIDNIEHLFWMYYDPDDPEYSDNNPYESVIPDFYHYYDEHVIGPFLSLLEEDMTLIVISDHGHGMRPTKVVNINEMLKRNGLLKTKQNGQNPGISSADIARRLKSSVVNAVSEYRIVGKAASKILSHFPGGLGAFTRITPIEKQGTKAYLSDPSGGLKAYSYAGIRIDREFLPADQYEEIRRQIFTELPEIRDPDTGERIVEWVKSRENVYTGPYLEKYPDVLFKLRDDWGVGWDINGSLYSSSPSHKLHSGNHRLESAVFLAYGEKIPIHKQILDLTDISPIILDLLNVPGE